MSHRTSTQRRTWKERALSLLLAAALVAGLTPGLTLPASAEHWADAYLDQLVDWGVMRADQTADPDADLTRAEFFAIINRAYGYTETGYIPFEDVLPTDWFYDDISIAYTAGYMAGTSDITASPNDTLTREQAFCILGRNMMLKDAPGESLAFADSRDVSDWARGTIKAAADNYIVSGFPDNTLHPQDSISKGQMAVLITQCLGNPIQQSGTYDLGGVFGNVTITAPNVTLRNATISGDLYISGGVGLGGIKLENVDVLGRIIVSGTGESEGGDASVIMRNVTADEMLVDNMRNKTVTVRADGITDIAKTIVRTNAYLEDNNTDDKGLMHIEVDGDPGLRLTLAGRIKEVVNKTPSSYIQAAKGTVAKLTVDEAATNSTVQIDRNTKIAEMNLDVATSVLGDGDIGQLNINAPGSVVTMLPDKIYIRPGLTASIAGVIMDYQAAEEGSLDPRLLAGYPAAKDIAPTGFRADFAGNKKGTIYWAVSYLSDGSIGEDDLISPPSYGSKAITNGSLEEPTGGEEVSAQVGSLVVGGSYYLSAILVDEQKERSPVKVISFSTPDNTVPAFAQGYPYMSRTTRSVAQVTVMPTKSCKLYYALLPQGAQAPTPNEMKAAAVIGNLGYGIRDVTKNTEDVFTVNGQRLEELKTYVLYLWLTDVDGVNSSAVTSLSFTLPDETPPEFIVEPHVNGNVTATSVPMAATVNENATIFWAVVAAGDPYPLPNRQSDPLSKDNEMDGNTPVTSKLTSDYAKLCVTSGMGALANGQVAAQANTEVTFNITGLQAEKAYDLYYVARDTAGNYSVAVKRLSGGIHTLDENGPVITQSFSALANRNDPDSPLASTDIVLDFSENIRCDKGGEGRDLVTLYDNRGNSPHDMELFVDALSKSILLFEVTEDGSEKAVVAWDGLDPDEEPANWVIRYNKVTVTQRADGHVIVTFPGTASTESNPENTAVRLSNGVQYFLRFKNLTDTSSEYNPVDEILNDQGIDYTNAEDKHHIPTFTTVFSQVRMTTNTPENLPEFWEANDSDAIRTVAVSSRDVNNQDYVRLDVGFRLNPETTENTPDEYLYDLLFYADTTVSYDLYYRVVLKDGEKVLEANGTALTTASPYYKNLILDYQYGGTTEAATSAPDKNGWRYLGGTSVNGTPSFASAGSGQSMNKNFTNCTSTFPQLKNLSEDLYYEFVISITEKDGDPEFANWSGEVGFDVYIEAGRRTAINQLGTNPTPGARDRMEAAGLNGDGVVNIGLEPRSGTKYLHGVAQFPNTTPPVFSNGYPQFYNDERAEEVIYDGTNTAGNKDRVALVGDTFAWMEVNLNAAGTIHYVVAQAARGADGKNGSNGVTTELDVKQTTGGNTTVTKVTDIRDVWNLIPTASEGSDPFPPEITVTKPSSLYVAQHQSPTTYPQDDRSSHYTYTSPGSTPDPIYIDGLRPNTDYYIYFSLEAQSDGTAPGAYSDVYVYKFKTAQTSGPKILLSGGDSNGIALVNVPNTNSRLTYLIYTETAIRQASTGKLGLLNQKLYDPDNGIDNAVDTRIPPAYKDYTIIQALLTPYRYQTALGSVPNGEDSSNYYFPPGGAAFNDYSVFDAYASDSAKADIYNLIRTGNEGTPVSGDMGGELRTVTVPRSSNDYSPLNSNAGISSYPHIILVTGCSTNEGVAQDDVGNYTFKAIDSIKVLDQSVGKPVKDMGSSITLNSTNGEPFSGDITLNFVGPNNLGRDMYYMSNTIPDPVEVHQNCTTDHAHQNINDVILKSGSVKLTDTTQSTSATSIFTFHYTDMWVGNVIRIPNTGDLTNSNGRDTAGNGLIELKESDGIYRITITWTSPDGTSEVVAEDIWPKTSSDSSLAPKLQNLSNPNGFSAPSPSANPNDDLYTGSFTVNFDKILYLIPRPNMNTPLGTSYQVTNDNKNDTVSPTIGGPNAGSVTVKTVTNGAYTAIEFEITNFKNTDSFTVFNDGSSDTWISDAYSNSRQAILKITLEVSDRTQSDGTIRRTVLLEYTMSSAENGSLILIPEFDVPPAAGSSLITANPTPPVVTGMNATSWTVDSGSGSNTMTLTMTFDQPIKTASAASNLTATYSPVNGKASTVTLPVTSSGSNYTLNLNRVKPGTITLPNQTFYDVTGKVSTTGTLTIKLEEVQQVDSKTGHKIPQVTVSFGSFTDSDTK